MKHYKFLKMPKKSIDKLCIIDVSCSLQNKERNNMSRIKRHLPEGYDATDPKDTGKVRPDFEPDNIDWALLLIEKNIKVLEQYVDECLEHRFEIGALKKRLMAVSKQLNEKARIIKRGF